jgi:hypothetical protein
MSHNAKLLMRLKELHKIFKHREIKAKNDQRFDADQLKKKMQKIVFHFRLEVAMEMKEELIQAMKKEKKDHGVLNMHLKMTKEIVNVLRKNFNLTGLNKDK